MFGDVDCVRWPRWLCFIRLPCLPLQGTLKEKTVENLEKYVVKDVSSLRSSEGGGAVTPLFCLPQRGRWL